MIPPNTTEGTTPNILAANPLSNWPSLVYFEFINIELTLLTRPRMWSGVFNCMTVPRMTTLTPSSMPATSKAKKDRINHLDNANNMMHMPKPLTVNKSFLPCALFSGAMVNTITTQMEPISIAAFGPSKSYGVHHSEYPWHKQVSLLGLLQTGWQTYPMRRRQAALSF